LSQRQRDTYDEVEATKTTLDHTERRLRLKPKRLAADTAYRTAVFWAGCSVGDSTASSGPRILPRCNGTEPICFRPYPYLARNGVEQFFNKIKQCRRIATRYARVAANYLALIQLASIRL